MAHLKLSLSYFLDVMRNDHIRQETKEKCQPWNERKIGGRSATVPHHTHLL